MSAGQAVRVVAANLLTHVVDNQANLDDLTDSFRGYAPFLKLEARDQLLAKAIVLATLRNKTRIEECLKKSWQRKPPEKARFLNHVLETAAAQILYMDVPESAAVNVGVTAIRADPRTTRFASFTNAVLRNITRQKTEILASYANHSIFSGWMQKMLVRDFGKEKTAQISSVLSLEPVIDLQGNPDALEHIVDSIALPGSGKRLTNQLPIHQIAGYQDGGWWVQDIAAAQPAKLLANAMGTTIGKTIADLCAAPGGKTMQLAASGANVVAVDISGRRIGRIVENLRRTKLKAQIIEADILTWQPEEKFDGVLLDAPCSATGTIRRHPDILWNTSRENLTELIQLQKALIEKAASLIKPGGILVYANCSLFKDEGENLVANLEGNNLDLDPIRPEELPGLESCINGQGTFRALPHLLKLEPQEKSGMDGFFAARFKVH